MSCFERFAALSLVLILTGCGSTVADKPSVDDPDMGPVEVLDADVETDTDPPDAGPDQSEIDADRIPERISTAGASFRAEIGPSDRILIKLDADGTDRVVIRFEKDGGTTWDPALQLFRASEQSPITFSDPDDLRDAHIPWRESDLNEGFEFWTAGEYDLILLNRSDSSGRFSFSLTCLGGPCKSAGGDADGDGIPDDLDNCPFIPNPDQTDDTGNGVGNACDPNYEWDPWAGLSNQQLVQALRDEHAELYRSSTYLDARQFMFSSLDNEEGVVECVYTGTRITTQGIPDGQVMNTEHTWPQSRGGGDSGARADLHHLFPVTASSNTQRSNLFFDDVQSSTWSEGGSSRGRNSSGDTRFEPRDGQKGAVARAIFYVAVVYGLAVESDEEAVLRRWHDSFPVDDAERSRHQSIANFQSSRNPFIDYPHLVDRIVDF